MKRTLLAVCALALSASMGCNGFRVDSDFDGLGVKVKTTIICPPKDGGEKAPQSTADEAPMPCKPMRVYDGDLQGPGSRDISGYASTQDFSVVVRVIDLPSDVASVAQSVFAVDGNEFTVHTAFRVDVAGVAGITDDGETLSVEDGFQVDWGALLHAEATLTVCVPAAWLDDDPEDPWQFKGVQVSGTTKDVLGHLFLELADVRELRLPVLTGSSVEALVLRHDTDAAAFSVLTVVGDAVHERLRVPVGSVFAGTREAVGTSF